MTHWKADLGLLSALINSSRCIEAPYVNAAQVGIMRRGRYVKGKKVGKGNVVNVVRIPAMPALGCHVCCLLARLQPLNVFMISTTSCAVTSAQQWSSSSWGWCLQGDEVKKGQPLGFIEQLGTYVPVEVRQDTSGNVAQPAMAFGSSSIDFRLTMWRLHLCVRSIQAPQAGEIVAFVADEGTAVEYAQPIIELVPFFGGHIIGDR